jgi:S-methylmethionine-dependent homocysteine/selenocysteine methylase
MRLSIEIEDFQHQQIKALAAMAGMTIKDYILDRTLPSVTEQEALTQLEKFLAPRIAAAELGQVSNSTIEEIIAQARARKDK